MKTLLYVKHLEEGCFDISKYYLLQDNKEIELPLIDQGKSLDDTEYRAFYIWNNGIDYFVEIEL